MRDSDTSSTWAWARIGAVAIAGRLAVFVSWIILFDPIPAWVDLVNAARARFELPRAAQRWQSRCGPDYQVHGMGAVPLALGSVERRLVETAGQSLAVDCIGRGGENLMRSGWGSAPPLRVNSIPAGGSLSAS